MTADISAPGNTQGRRILRLYHFYRLSIGLALIQELVRLATLAPTAFNLQNWRFIAVRTPDPPGPPAR